MTPSMVPNSIYGAILLSLVDFFLSFVVIAFIGFILALFPHLNRINALIASTPCKRRRWRSPSCLHAMRTPNMWR